MAPSAPSSSSSRTTTTKPFPTIRPRRKCLKASTRTRHLNNKKKQNPLPPPQTNTSPEISKIPEASEDSPSSSSSSSSSEVITTDEPLSSSSSSCCSTPKGDKFRIPEIAACPPAPKKKKPVSLLSNDNCSRRRSPISFFAPPDLELFFFLALPDNIPV